MEYNLKEDFNVEERNALIRFAISYGDRATCATRCLMRPFKPKYLTDALNEDAEKHEKIIVGFEKKAEDYAEGKIKPSQSMIEFFDGVPTERQFANYCRSMIRQEKDAARKLRCNYQIIVNYECANKANMTLHKSFNPRPTFGSTNVLHEECDFMLTQDKKDTLLNSSLKDVREAGGKWYYDNGCVFFGSIIQLMYENLCIYKDERCILYTASHEGLTVINFTDEELDSFLKFEGKLPLNARILRKLNRQTGYLNYAVKTN